MSILKDTTCLISGGVGSSKTFLAVDLAMTMGRAALDESAPAEWFGQEFERGGVIYATDHGSDPTRMRMQAWLKGAGLAPATRLPVYFLTTERGRAAPSDTFAAIARAAKEMRAEFGMRPAAIIIDPLCRLTDDPGAAGSAAAISAIYRLRQTTDASVFVTRTVGGSGGPRGDDSVRADFDTEILVRVHQHGSRYSWTVTRAKRGLVGAQRDFSLRSALLDEGAAASCYVVPRPYAAASQRPTLDGALIVNRVSSLGEIAERFRLLALGLRADADALPSNFAAAEREARARAQTWEAAADFLDQTYLAPSA